MSAGGDLVAGDEITVADRAPVKIGDIGGRR